MSSEAEGHSFADDLVHEVNAEEFEERRAALGPPRLHACGGHRGRGMDLPPKRRLRSYDLFQPVLPSAPLSSSSGASSSSCGWVPRDGRSGATVVSRSVGGIHTGRNVGVGTSFGDLGLSIGADVDPDGDPALLSIGVDILLGALPAVSPPITTSGGTTTTTTSRTATTTRTSSTTTRSTTTTTSSTSRTHTSATHSTSASTTTAATTSSSNPSTSSHTTSFPFVPTSTSTSAPNDPTTTMHSSITSSSLTTSAHTISTTIVTTPSNGVPSTITATSTIFATGTLSPNAGDANNSIGHNAGAIAGITIGALVGLAFVSVWIFFAWRRHNRIQNSDIFVGGAPGALNFDPAARRHRPFGEDYHDVPYSSAADGVGGGVDATEGGVYGGILGALNLPHEEQKDAMWSDVMLASGGVASSSGHGHSGEGEVSSVPSGYAQTYGSGQERQELLATSARPPTSSSSSHIRRNSSGGAVMPAFGQAAVAMAAAGAAGNSGAGDSSGSSGVYTSSGFFSPSAVGAAATSSSGQARMFATPPGLTGPGVGRRSQSHSAGTRPLSSGSGKRTSMGPGPDPGLWLGRGELGFSAYSNNDPSPDEPQSQSSQEHSSGQGASSGENVGEAVAEGGTEGAVLPKSRSSSHGHGSATSHNTPPSSEGSSSHQHSEGRMARSRRPSSQSPPTSYNLNPQRQTSLDDHGSKSGGFLSRLRGGRLSTSGQSHHGISREPSPVQMQPMGTGGGDASSSDEHVGLGSNRSHLSHESHRTRSPPPRSPSVPLPRSPSAPSSLLNPLHNYPPYTTEPLTRPPPRPTDPRPRRPWATGPLTLPPLPSPDVIPVETEGLLDPRLGRHLSPIEQASTSSFGDHLDYSRPIGGLVNNRMHSASSVHTLANREALSRHNTDNREELDNEELDS